MQGGLTIKLIFNKLDRWSKALKYMLANLKWAMKWCLDSNAHALAASLAAAPTTRPASAAGSSVMGGYHR